MRDRQNNSEVNNYIWRVHHDWNEYNEAVINETELWWKLSQKGYNQTEKIICNSK